MSLEWLSPQDRDWVTRHRYFIEAVWERFDESGTWPDPVAVQRELRAADPSRRVNAALAEMPASLARREYVPAQLILSVFGLACCAGARPLLRQYLEVARLALRRFDSPELPNRLTRAEVVAALGLSDAEADRLSQVLMSDAPFLGGGNPTVANWDLEVDPRAEEFDGIESTDALIDFLSRQRRIAVEREPTILPAHHVRPVNIQAGTSQSPAATSPADPSSTDLRTRVTFWATVSSTLIAVATFVITVVRPPPAVWVSLVAALLILVVGLAWMQLRRHFPIVAVVAGLVLFGAAGVLLIPRSNEDGPYRYFVASTGSTAVIVGRIEPRRGAAPAPDTVLGLGDSTTVSCLRRERGEIWAQLPDGSFVPAGLLSAEVGGQIAPSC
jgi:hypothetical protein